jgi:pyrimidine operon attenuation protein/uracil phosphoribosyltransferase
MPDTPMNSTEGSVVLDGDGIRRTITRLAHEVVERNGGLDGLVLVGIQTRGVAIAQRLATLIEGFEGARPAVGSLDITMRRAPPHPVARHRGAQRRDHR